MHKKLYRDSINEVVTTVYRCSIIEEDKKRDIN